MASTKNLMPLRSSSREKKASRHIGFSFPITWTIRRFNFAQQTLLQCVLS